MTTNIKQQTTTKANQSLALKEENLINRIYLIRGEKVMLDFDLALLYETETRILKQAVRRNLKRFPAVLCLSLQEKNLQT